MATRLGSTNRVSTWGKFRVVWCVQLAIDYEGGPNSITYNTGIKSAADGSGLIRHKPSSDDVFSDERQPTIWGQPFTVSFPPPVAGNRIYAAPVQPNPSSPTGYEASMATDELKAELTGATVNFSSERSTTITEVFWDEGRYTWNPAQPDPFDAGVVVSIEKFVAFT